MKCKDLLSIADLTSDDVWRILYKATEIKQHNQNDMLTGKTLALIFEKPSLRTKVSFTVAMHQLGGYSIYLSQQEIGLGSREPIGDVARTLSRYVNIIAARTFAHTTVEALAKYATVPVINALSDWEHPCQAMADILTIYEKKGKLEGIKVAYIGDGNNVANSLLLACALTGAVFHIASPQGYQAPESIVAQGRNIAKDKHQILLTERPDEACRAADVIYTDVWTSMGQENEAERRRRDFVGYQVNATLLSYAAKDAIIMHPLPAHYGEEISEKLIDSQQLAIFDQAENRLHVQKAILSELLKKL